VASLSVVEDLEVLEDRVGELQAGAPPTAFSDSVCIRAQNASIMPLS
jgi:hypothetical protein